MNIISKSFKELSVNELYDILRLRNAVFVVEQHCAYQDVDGYDQAAQHLLYPIDGTLAGYARILLPGSKYQQISIGRVVVDAAHRGKDLARQLMDFAITEGRRLYPKDKLMVQAQSYLEKFYQSLGFVTYKGPYDDDGIPHIDMEMVAS